MGVGVGVEVALLVSAEALQAGGKERIILPVDLGHQGFGRRVFAEALIDGRVLVARVPDGPQFRLGLPENRGLEREPAFLGDVLGFFHDRQVDLGQRLHAGRVVS